VVSNRPRIAQAKSGGDFCMFPYFWGGTPYSGASGLNFVLFARDIEPGLPEEVRAAIEEHREEIHSEEDLRRMAEELMLRR
jgi:hypothetical protein